MRSLVLFKPLQFFFYHPTPSSYLSILKLHLFAHLLFTSDLFSASASLVFSAYEIAMSSRFNLLFFVCLIFCFFFFFCKMKTFFMLKNNISFKEIIKFRFSLHILQNFGIRFSKQCQELRLLAKL